MGSKNHDIKFDNINWSTDKVILTTIHRRENWGEKLKCIIEGLKIIADKYRDIKFILPMHKNLKSFFLNYQMIQYYLL